jgi:hypothetical protein
MHCSWSDYVRKAVDWHDRKVLQSDVLVLLEYTDDLRGMAFADVIYDMAFHALTYDCISLLFYFEEPRLKSLLDLFYLLSRFPPQSSLTGPDACKLFRFVVTTETERWCRSFHGILFAQCLTTRDDYHGGLRQCIAYLGCTLDGITHRPEHSKWHSDEFYWEKKLIEYVKMAPIGSLADPLTYDTTLWHLRVTQCVQYYFPQMIELMTCLVPSEREPLFVNDGFWIYFFPALYLFRRLWFTYAFVTTYGCALVEDDKTLLHSILVSFLRFCRAAYECGCILQKEVVSLFRYALSCDDGTRLTFQLIHGFDVTVLDDNSPFRHPAPTFYQEDQQGQRTVLLSPCFVLPFLSYVLIEKWPWPSVETMVWKLFHPYTDILLPFWERFLLPHAVRAVVKLFFDVWHRPLVRKHFHLHIALVVADEEQCHFMHLNGRRRFPQWTMDGGADIANAVSVDDLFARYPWLNKVTAIFLGKLHLRNIFPCMISPGDVLMDLFPMSLLWCQVAQDDNNMIPRKRIPLSYCVSKTVHAIMQSHSFIPLAALTPAIYSTLSGTPCHCNPVGICVQDTKPMFHDALRFASEQPLAFHRRKYDWPIEPGGMYMDLTEELSVKVYGAVREKVFHQFGIVLPTCYTLWFSVAQQKKRKRIT